MGGDARGEGVSDTKEMRGTRDSVPEGPSPGQWPLVARILSSIFVVVVAGCTLVGMPPPTPPPAPSPGGAAGPDGTPPTDPADFERSRSEASSGEIRALWVVRTALAHPDSARAMVRRAHRAGFNTLLVQVRGRGDAFYRSRFEPRAEVLARAPSEYDPLGVVLDEAHGRGIEVHAWANVHLVHGMGELPRSPRHLVRSGPDLLALPRELARELRDVPAHDPAYVRTLLEWTRRNDDRVEGLFTSPSDPRVKHHVERVLRDLLDRYDLDGIHLDYIRYPAPEYDYSPGALEAFRAWVGPRIPASRREALDRSIETDPLAYPDALPDLWDRFRREQVTDLVRRARRMVDETRRDVQLTAAVRAEPTDARDHRYQDWPGWLEAGLVDAVAPMAYTEDRRLFRSWVDDAVRWAGGDRVWAGIGVYKTTLPGTLEQIRIARARGAAGVALFSYDWAVAEAPAGRSGDTFLESVGRAAFDAPVGLE